MKLMNATEEKQTHRCTEQMSGYQWERERGGQDIHVALRDTNYYIQNK